jgi:3-methyladenine DNA glycosylase AlkD
MDDKNSIRKRLDKSADEKYRAFSSSLIPGKDNIIGVRLPTLRKLAGEIVRGDWRSYLKQAADETMEEVMLQGMVIGKCKADIDEILMLTADFIPKIDNWSVCDSFCTSLKIVKQYRERFWNFIVPYLKSDKEYEVRFGVVMLLNYYVLPEYITMAFQYFNQIRAEGCYAKIAVAWAISAYYVKFPEQTMEYLKNNELDDFTYQKALQKITESLRVDREAKKIIGSMKRKGGR